MPWVGWFRVDELSPWQKACTADTIEDCARRLSAATRHLRLKNVNECITAGQVPTNTRKEGQIQ